MPTPSFHPAPLPAPAPAPLPATAADARDRVVALLQACGLPPESPAVTDALMLTSELVTNAIRHGRGMTAFRADVHGSALRISVADRNPDPPVARTGEAPGIRIGGYGWPLVQSLAEHLTVTRHGTGKQITADLRIR
ncbi:ATP-binding protein [Streptomyces sp. cmx-4-9]|uniref:ATP-binding protein n=1 Tax=Streptomyces sp. cmx-4-9 TaxID=2790941 RepID=UPI00397F37A8